MYELRYCKSRFLLAKISKINLRDRDHQVVNPTSEQYLAQEVHLLYI